MKTRMLWIIAGVLLLPAMVSDAEEPALSPEGAVAVAEAISASIVRVEYELQQYNGQSPPQSYAAEVIPQERPLDSGGYVLSPTQILCVEYGVQPRFIKDTWVQSGDRRIKAAPSAYAIGQVAYLLEPAEPLKDAKPLVFDPTKKGGYLHVYSRVDRGARQTFVQALSWQARLTENGNRFLRVDPYCLITDVAGVPVGMIMRDEMPPDDSWKGSPLQWKMLAQAGLKAALEKLEQQASLNMLRVKLNFRSPGGKTPQSYRRYRSKEDDSVTEMNVIGLLMDGSTLLVTANLKPKVTARLDRIMVYPPDGKPVQAQYICALADFGCLLAKLDAPLPGAVKLAPEKTPGDLLALTDQLMLSVVADVQGEKRVTHFGHDRIRSYELGWRRNVYPRVDSDENLYLFNLKGELAAMPMARRQKMELGDHGRYGGSGGPVLTSVAIIRPALADPKNNADTGNVPLGEAQENRLAWMGVELQPLDADLARANNVSDLTDDGETGALVSYVYPESPAGKAGVEPGWVLLRLHVQGQPAPLEVKLDESSNPYSGEAFPWDKLDQLPEQYFDEIPRPWPPAENTFTRSLTDFGIGTKYAAELFHNGQTVRKELEVVDGPPHFDSAPRFSHKQLGVTVRDMTYEVRRYFQRKPDDPGVIISKVERGSKASVSGIKPFEMITHVNDAPVASVKEFERLAQGQDELRLMVKRMTRDRVVKVKFAAAAEKKEPEKKEQEKEPAEK